MNFFQKLIVRLAKKYIYIDWRSHEIQEVNWEISDQKSLYDFLDTSAGKKLVQSLVNAEVFKMQEIFNLSGANREHQIGMVQGSALTRSKIIALATPPQNTESNDTDLSLAELDDVIKERLLGYNNRRYSE